MDQIIELIKWSAQPDNQIQKQVYKRAQEFSKDKQFLINLCSIIIGEYDVDIKFRAAVILKSAIKNCQTIPEQLQQILIQVDFSDQILRQAFLIVVPEIVVRNGIKNSNSMMDYLIKLIDSDPIIATDCLSKIIEDLKFNTENINYYDTDSGLQLMDQLIIKFITLVQHSNNQVVVNSLNFLNYNVFFMPPSLSQNCEYYINILLIGTQSQETQIRLKCFQGIQALIETKRDRIKQMDKVIQACVTSLRDTDKEVVRFAELCLTDFLCIDDADDYQQIELLKPYLQQIVPIIIINLQITKQDQISIQPIFSNVYKKSEESDEEEDKPLGEYSLRQVSNKLLTKLLDNYSLAVVPIGLQLIDQLQQQQDWQQQEVAVVSLGLFAEKIIENHANLIPNIIKSLFNQQYQVNEYLFSSTLWTFSQYNQWIQTIAATETQFIQSYLQLLLVSIEHQSIIVKESACSALNSLSKDAFFILQPYLTDLFQVYLKALSQEGGVLLYIYQSLATTLQQCESIENQELVDLIMSKLCQKLVDLNEQTICPLYGMIIHYLECLAEAIERFEKKAINYIQVIFQAALQSMRGYVQTVQSGKTRNLFQQKEILKRAMEVCSQIITVVGQHFLELADHSFLMILEVALQDSETDVRQYALSLIGELIKGCYQIFQNANIATVLNENIYAISISADPSKIFLATSNNAAWALGELAMKDHQKITPIFQNVMDKLIKIINEPTFPKPIAQNLIIAILRIAYSHIQLIDEYVPKFFKRACLILSQIKSQSFDEFKEQAFMILINIVKLYPNQVINEIKYFVYCVVVSNEYPSIKQSFVEILQQLKSTFGQQKFESIFTGNDLPQGFRSKMLNVYGV